MLIEHRPSPALAGRVVRYCGFEERTPQPLQRREGPGVSTVLVFAFEEHWLINGERHTSFTGGLHEAQVTTEHPGRSLGLQVDLDPLAARALFGLPAHELANRTVPLDDVLSPELAERLANAGGWPDRFALLDEALTAALADARPSAEIAWAWGRLRSSHGRIPVGALCEELGWSRKRIVARFRDELGLPPKAVARLLRFERARSLAGTMAWGELAYACGFADQSHLINEFRAITGRTPETFLQDTLAAVA
jgi:AraC-like DNA-binding protein